MNVRHFEEGARVGNYVKISTRFISWHRRKQRLTIAECQTCGSHKWIAKFALAPKECQCHPWLNNIKYRVGEKYGCYYYKRKVTSGYLVQCECGNTKTVKQISNPPKSCVCKSRNRQIMESILISYGEEWQSWLNKPWGTSRQRLNSGNNLSAISATSLGLLKGGNWRKVEELAEISKKVKKSLPKITVFRNIAIKPIY